MIITYQDNQDAVLFPKQGILSLNGISLTTEFSNVTNKSMTLSCIVTNDINLVFGEKGFRLSYENNTGINLSQELNNVTDTNNGFTLRVKDLIPNTTYQITSYVKFTVDGITSEYTGDTISKTTILPTDLSNYTDMSYADLRDMDLSSTGLRVAREFILKTFNHQTVVTKTSSSSGGVSQDKRVFDGDIETIIFWEPASDNHYDLDGSALNTMTTTVFFPSINDNLSYVQNGEWIEIDMLVQTPVYKLNVCILERETMQGIYNPFIEKFVLVGSNDGINFTTVYDSYQVLGKNIEYSYLDYSTSRNIEELIITNPHPWRYYRFIVSKLDIKSKFKIIELQLFTDFKDPPIFDECLVNDNTVFENVTGTQKHYYHYDISSDYYKFKVDIGTDLAFINSLVSKTETEKYNMKLVRVNELFRENPITTEVIIKPKGFLGLVDTDDMIYSDNIQIFNPHIQTNDLSIHTITNEIVFNYKLITSNTLTNSETTNGYFTILKNKELIWYPRINASLIYNRLKLTIHFGIVYNILAQFIKQHSLIFSVYDNFYNGYVQIPFGINETSTVYNPVAFDNSLYIRNATLDNIDLSHTTLKYLFNIYASPIDINNIPYISTVYKDIADTSISIGCNLEYLTAYNNVDITIYISKDPTKIKNCTTIDSGDFSKSETNGLKSKITVSRTGITGFRVYSLTPNTTYYIMSSVTYTNPKLNIDHTDYTVVETVTTIASSNSNLLSVSDLSYTDLSNHSNLSSIPNTVNLTNAIVNVKNTIFPTGKKFFDYPIRIKELINVSPDTDNNSLITLDLNAENQEKIRKMIIDQYLSDKKVEMIDVSNKFLGFNDNTKRPVLTIIKNNTQKIDLSTVGNLEEKTLYKHMDENSVFELEESSVRYLDVSLKIVGPINGVYEVSKLENITTSSSSATSELPMGIVSAIPYLSFNKGDTFDCFSEFGILKGYTITLNSVEVSKYKNAVLTGLVVQFNDNGLPVQDKIKYKITLDSISHHTLTFTLTDGTIILIQAGNTVGTKISSISYGRTVSILSVSGGLSNFVNTSGTVTITTEVINDNYLLSEEHRFENVSISMNTPDAEINYPDGINSNIKYLEDYISKFNHKVPFYGRYCLSDIKTVTGPSNVFKYTTYTNDITASVYSINTTDATIQINIRDGIPLETISLTATVSGSISDIISGVSLISETSLYNLSDLTPYTQYNYIATMGSKTCSGSFKTNPVELTVNQTIVDNTITNQIKQSTTTLIISSNYTMTRNSKIVHNLYKCITSNPISTASDIIYWKGSFEVGRYYEKELKYPIQNKIMEFDVISASGIYKHIKKVKMHFVDRNETNQTIKYHMFELLN